jgi:hypothetical protein
MAWDTGLDKDSVAYSIASAPEPRVPFALPLFIESVLEQHSDAPGYAETKDGALFLYGYGLGLVSAARKTE